MKHIKLFKEGFNKEDYYVSIDESEYSYDDVDDFDKELANKLTKEYGLKSEVIYIGYSNTQAYHGLSIRSKVSYPRNILITQHKDEWFYIRGEVDDIMSCPYNPSYIYFKCDQVEGLMEFLKDYGFIS
jgi:hypothetical protein